MNSTLADLYEAQLNSPGPSTGALGLDTKITLRGAGLIFLLALVHGLRKYRQILTSEDHRAHPYVDIAHRAALLYSFATLLIAVFVQRRSFPTGHSAAGST
jgi:hypothetical protein